MEEIQVTSKGGIGAAIWAIYKEVEGKCITPIGIYAKTHNNTTWAVLYCIENKNRPIKSLYNFIMRINAQKGILSVNAKIENICML